MKLLSKIKALKPWQAKTCLVVLVLTVTGAFALLLVFDYYNRRNYASHLL